MPTARRISKTLPPLAVILFALCSIQPAQAQLPDIVFNVPDTTASTSDSLIWLNLYFSNYFDTVAGIQFQLQLSRPDLIRFDFSDSGFSPAGTLLEEWDLLTATDQSDSATVLRFSGLANFINDPVIIPGILPQHDGTILRLPLIVTTPPDLTGSATCNIDIVAPTSFSDFDGNSIGIATDTLTDTLYFLCTDSLADSCIHYEPVDPDTSNYDSVYIYEYLDGYMDSSKVILDNGSITVIASLQSLSCDFTGDTEYSVSDLTCLVNFLFGVLDSQQCPNTFCDCDSSGNEPNEPNVSDLTCIIDFLFRGGPAPGD